MQKVYFIAGLGADKRNFQFLDLSFCEPVFIEWKKPLPNESLAAYALRLREVIQEERPVIVGLSFGGMLTTEMAKADKNVKGIIISSNKLHAEFPYWLGIGKYLPVYKWMPNNNMSNADKATLWMLGVQGKEQTTLLKQIIKESDKVFVKWAIEAIMKWDNKVVPANIIHIHGTADRLLPYRFVKADYTIKGGSHLMIMDHAQEVSALLKKIIIN